MEFLPGRAAPCLHINWIQLMVIITTEKHDDAQMEEFS